MSDSTSDAPEVTPDPEIDLDALRVRIDAIDEKIISALSERAQVVSDIGRSKRASGAPIYAPHRERQVLDRVIAANPGPLPDRTIEAIYRELMSGSFAIELPIRVAFLGPRGSFSHVAATRHFGSSVEFEGLQQIEDVFEEVAAGRARYGLVPYENSIGGGITDTLDAFPLHDVTVYAEAMIDVEQNLLTNAPQSAITHIYSKPQIFSQCRRWLQKMFPDATQVPMLSSSDAVRHVVDDAHAAAIGTLLAGEIYGVKPLFESIQDKANNITRFLIIANEAAKPSGDDKTSIMFGTAHKPGALVDVLNDFRDAGINLSHIEKRPSGRVNWEYSFFIDVDGHVDDPALRNAIDAAKAHCVALKVLGSYPRTKRSDRALKDA